MLKSMLLCLAVLLTLTSAAYAQEEKPDSSSKSAAADDSRFYRLEFVVKEVDGNGKVINSRSYSTMCSTARNSAGGSIRTGSRVPMTVNDKHDLQYVDLGVNIDANQLHTVGNDLAMVVIAELSTAASQTEAPAPPVIRQNRWTSNIVIPMNHPTTLFSSDDLNSKGKIQVELTVIPVR